jgi:hypothetical protein
MPMSHDRAVEALSEIDEHASDITFATFARRTNWQEWARAVGYDIGGRGRGPRLGKDWAVRFFRSRMHGKPVYVCMWSAYHVIFAS